MKKLNAILFALALTALFPKAMAQVKLLQQQFDPSTLTFDLVVENQGQEALLLREVGAEYQIYYHTLWLGIGDLPTLKSSANYEIPIFLAPECYEAEYLKEEVVRNDLMYGIWNCANYIPTEPALYLPAGEPTRIRVQAIPKAMKSYWEMEITLHLELVFDNGTQLATEPHLLFTDDIIGVLLTGRILDKEKILAMVNDPEHQGEFINIRDWKLGKLEYSFSRAVAVHHLDKIGLSRDSIEVYLKKLLKDPDSMVRLSASKVARKYQLTSLLDDLKATWPQFPEYEMEGFGYLVNPGLLYALAHFGQFQYVDSAFLRIHELEEPQSLFFHLANLRDSVYGEKLHQFFTQHGKEPIIGYDWKEESFYRTLAGHFCRYPSERNARLLAELLENSPNDYIIKGIIQGLEGTYANERARTEFLAQFEPYFLELYSTHPDDRYQLLKLLYYTTDEPEPIQSYIGQALASEDWSLRQAAFGILAGREGAMSTSSNLLWHWINQLGEHSAEPKDSIRVLARQLVSADYLSTASSQDILGLFYVFRDRHQSVQAAIPDSANAFENQFLDEITQAESLNHHLSLPTVTAVLLEFKGDLRDSLRAQQTATALDKRMQETDLASIPLSELSNMAESLEKIASAHSPNPEKKIYYYQLATRCYDAAVKADTTAALLEAATTAYNELAWYQLLNKEPAAAAATCERGLAIQKRPILYTNLALGYLLSGQKDKALELYQKLKDEPYLERNLRYGGKPYRVVFLADLLEMEAEGAIAEKVKRYVEEVRELLEE